MVEKEYNSEIDKLFDEVNNENLFLKDEQGNTVEFEQIAVLSYDERIFAILRPLDEKVKLADDEALVFELIETEEDEVLELCKDVDVIDAVFAAYEKLVEDAAKKA